VKEIFITQVKFSDKKRTSKCLQNDSLSKVEEGKIKKTKKKKNKCLFYWCIFSILISVILMVVMEK
jgi:hypothetical protein